MEVSLNVTLYFRVAKPKQEIAGFFLHVLIYFQCN